MMLKHIIGLSEDSAVTHNLRMPRKMHSIHIHIIASSLESSSTILVALNTICCEIISMVVEELTF